MYWSSLVLDIHGFINTISSPHFEKLLVFNRVKRWVGISFRCNLDYINDLDNQSRYNCFKVFNLGLCQSMLQVVVINNADIIWYAS